MPDRWIDQAEGLRKLLIKTPPHIVTLCSAMSEPGRPWALLNLAAALKQAGSDVLIVDAAAGQDGGLMEVPLQPIQLQNVIQGECCFSKAVSIGPEGIPVIAARSGVEGLVEALSNKQKLRSQLKLELGSIEVLLINTVPNLSGLQCADALLDQELVMTVRPERESVASTFKLIQTLSKRSSQRQYRLLVTGNPSIREAQRLHHALATALERSSNIKLSLLGVMPADRYVYHAASHGRTVVASNPHSFSAASFRKMADSLIRCRAAGLNRFAMNTLLVSKNTKQGALSSVRG